MRPTITLNGINSNSIEGLLIQSLPPITKPLIRTQIEEIDGRDGDVITKLGFSAYNKEITIGLYGDFDINAIISFFNSEGTVIFSNEPDKYYYYQIIDQIDFERLIRYRTATVTMHCQPFKYSTTEGTEVFDNSSNLLTIPNSTTTTNGVTVTVNNNLMTISGTASAATEFYIPIDMLSLSVGKYGMYALGSGTNPQACSLRVIKDSPSNANSFGGNYVTLQNNKTVSLLANISNARAFNYIYLYIAANTAMDFTLNLSIEDAAQSVITAEGNLLTLQGTAFAPFSKFDLKGDTTQQTYSGKNLLGTQTTSDVYHTTIVTNTANGLVLKPTAAGNAFIECTIPASANTQYTASMDINVSGVPSGATYDGTVYWYSKNSGGTRSYIDGVTKKGHKTKTFTTKSDTEYLIFRFFSCELVNTGWENIQSTYSNIQLEQGSTATSHEPYVGGIPAPNPDYPQPVQVVTGEQTVTITDGGSQSQEYTVSLGSIELCKIGDYQDYIYKSGDDWYVHKACGKKIIQSSEITVNSSYTNVKFASIPKPNDFIGYDNYDEYDGLCTHAVHTVRSGSWDQAKWEGCMFFSPGKYQFYIGVSKTLTNDQVKAILDGAILDYPLTTPTDIQITDSSLIAQLEALVTDAHAYRDTTTLVSSSANLPHIMSVEVAKNNDATITNSGNTTAKPVMTVYGSGTVGIYLNGNQIFNVNIGNNQYITIDTANMEAYKDTTDNLMNRLVDGDYSNFVLQTGENQISFSGSVSKLEISNYSRWI